MISLKKAFRPVFQPATFILSFFWMIFHVVSLLFFFQSIIEVAFQRRGMDQFLNQLGFGSKVYALLVVFMYFLTFIYFLIVTKKAVFENPPNFSLSFFIRKSAVLLPCFLIYTFVVTLLISVFGVSSVVGKIGTVVGILALSYLFLSFVIAYIEHFNFDSVRRLFVPALKKAQGIALVMTGGIAYTVLTSLVFKYLGLGTRAFLQWLLPLLLPCGFVMSIFVLFLLSIFVGLLYKGLPKKGQALLLASFILIIPSIILYRIIGLPFNWLMFMVVGQIIWYWIYLYALMIMSIFSFWASLLAHAARDIAMPNIPESHPAQPINPPDAA